MAKTTARGVDMAELEPVTPMIPDEPVGTPDNPQKVDSTPQKAQVANISRIDKMRAHFLAQPRVRVKVRNDGPVRVQVNGYSFLIQPNVPVEVPEQVAELLEQADYI